MMVFLLYIIIHFFNYIFAVLTYIFVATHRPLRLSDASVAAVTRQVSRCVAAHGRRHGGGATEDIQGERPRNN